MDEFASLFAAVVLSTVDGQGDEAGIVNLQPACFLVWASISGPPSVLPLLIDLAVKTAC